MAELSVASFPRVHLTHGVTPLEPLPNLSKELGSAEIWIKRDDCTGLAMGGNKTRQLEYYFGEAQARNADTILITGSVQSNYIRQAVAAACKLGMAAEVQLENRTPHQGEVYRTSGNVYLMKLMGAKIHHYPEGEDESGADAALYKRAEELKAEGKRPYVIPLGPGATPLGALGYVDCARELIQQMKEKSLHFDGVVVASGSGVTHSGLLVGLRASGSTIPVYGICVRRNQEAQRERISKKIRVVAEMIGRPDCVSESDVWVDDPTLSPGYGLMNKLSKRAVRLCAEKEGILLDPVYTGKSMGGLFHLLETKFKPGQRVLFIHTGGTPALFAYPNLIDEED